MQVRHLPRKTTSQDPHRGGAEANIPGVIADVAQLVEQGFCKAQVAGSIPVVGSAGRVVLVSRQSLISFR